MRDIKGYEGLYAVTSCGKIYSYKRKAFLRPGKNSRGYLCVNLSKNGKSKTYYLHRLVVETYIPNPENKLEINHKDENKTNNCVNNLEWISHKDNCNFGTRNERSGKARRKKVVCIETQEIFNSLTEAGKAINRSESNISQCLKGIINTCAGYHWAYYNEDK